MANKITTFLMFKGQAEEAMNFYISLFGNSGIKNITRYKKGEAGREGTVMQAIFSLKGQEFMCIDSAVEHAFGFTPAISLYINCDSEQEINMLFKKLSEGARVYMKLNTYGFSKKFAWLEDKFGVSWQLNLKQ
jgi:predicted 3-demethylubiquinone-9 3-methyltransferase (glyoxalase superfamily)